MSFYKIRPRSGTKAQWETANTILAEREIGYELPDGGVGTGVVKMKMGDGVTAWNDLPYIGENEIVNMPTHYDFPSIGNPNTIYKAEQEQKIYQWNSRFLKYELIGTDTSGVLDIDLINGGNANGNS